MITNAFFLVLSGLLQFYLYWANVLDRIAKQNRERWANLTRPLKLSAEEAYLKQITEEKRTLHAFRNQDIKNYNYKTWWSEYYQARGSNVN